MLRALFLAVYPHEAASTRFRFTQFFPYLERSGVSCEFAAVLPSREFSEFYVRGGAARKARAVALGALRQTIRAVAMKRPDLVVVQRGALPVGPPVIEAWIARVRRVPLVYDFDDAIWLHETVTPQARLTRIAKYPAKVAQIIHLAAEVIVCNEYTRAYARRFREGRVVTVIPTVVDANVFSPIEKKPDRLPTVGWVGTHSTAHYLAAILDPIRQVATRHAFTLKIVGSNREWHIPGVDVTAKRWSLDEEVADYQSLDVGLYPVFDDEWGRGKTGFKPVVYMASGAVCVASPVGGVTEFLRHGVNGLLASNASEWSEHLARVLSDATLRKRLAAGGRKTVVDWYSLGVQAPRLLEVLSRAAARRPS